MKDGGNPRETSVRGVGISLDMRTKYIYLASESPNCYLLNQLSQRSVLLSASVEEQNVCEGAISSHRTHGARRCSVD